MLRDLRHAVRLLLQAKAWSAVVLLSLAIGVGANIALFNIVNGLLLRAVPVRDPGSLVRLRWSGPNDALTNHSEYGSTSRDADGSQLSVAFSYPMFQELAANNRTLTDLIACAPFGRVNVVVDGQADIARAFISSGNYFNALGVSASLGRLFQPEDDRATAPAVAVISDRYWRSRFGADRQVIGKVIRVNAVPVTVIGVVPPEFTGIQEPLAEAPDVSVLLALERPLRAGPGASNVTDPQNWWLEVVGRVKPGVTPAQVEANLGPVFQQTARANLDAYLAGMSARERSRSGNANLGRIPQLRVQPGSKGVYDADESVVRSTTMLTVAVRLSVGATRGRLIRQMLTESLVLAVTGGVLGLAVGVGGAELLPAAWGRPAPIDGHVALFVIAIVGLTTLVFGFAPALMATRVTLNTTLKDMGRGVVGSRRLLSKSLLVTQVALALVLVAGAALFVRTTNNLRHVDVGFNPNHILLFTVNPQLNRYEQARTLALYGDLLNDLRAVPGVRAAALSQPALLSGSTNVGGVFIQGRTYTRGQAGTDRMNRVIVSPSFFQTMEMPITMGRGLTEHDVDGAPPVALINEASARQYFPNVNPVGQRFGPGFEDRSRFEIVGVVRDVKYNSLRDSAPPTMYVPYQQARTFGVTFEVRTAGEPTAAVGSIREIVRQRGPDLPLINVSTQLEQIANRFQQERTFAQAAGRLVRTFLFALAPTDALSIGAAVLIMLAVSALAGYLPARRASRVSPLVALRSE